MWRLLAVLAASGCGGSDGGGESGDASASEGGAGGGRPPSGGGEGPPAPSRVFPTDRLVEAELRFDPADWAALQEQLSVEAEFPAQVRWDDIVLDQVSVRLRGASRVLEVADADSDRFSFQLDLNDTLPDQSLDGERKLNLHHAHEDPTHLREILALEVLRGLGAPAPRAALVHLKVNGDSLGVYTVVEAVDGGFLEESFADPDGPLYELEAPAGTLMSPFDPEGLDVERGDDTTLPPPDLLALVAALAGDDDAALERVIDVEATLRHLAGQAALVNLGSYLGRDAELMLYGPAGVFTPIPEEARDAFALGTCGCPLGALLALPVEEPSCDPGVERPLLTRLLKVPALRDRYRVHVERAAAALEALPARVEALAALIRPVLSNDPGPFFSLKDFEWSLTRDLPRPHESDKAAIPGLSRFLTERAASLRALLAGQAPATANGLGACPKAPDDDEDEP